MACLQTRTSIIENVEVSTVQLLIFKQNKFQSFQRSNYSTFIILDIFIYRNASMIMRDNLKNFEVPDF